MQKTRTDDPADARNWAMDCAAAGCGMRFGKDVAVGVVGEHWNLEHAGKKVVAVMEAEVAKEDSPVMNLIWIGVGQAPEAS